VLNCLFRTSAGVSGMSSSPWRVELGPLWTLPDQISCTACNRTSITRNSTMKLRSKATVPSLRDGM